MEQWRTDAASRFDDARKAGEIPRMTSQPPYYRIYLLTVWQERSRGPPIQIIWRFRLEDPRTGRQQGFADARVLIIALLKIVTPSRTRQEESDE